MIGEDVKGKIWEVQAMCQNDSTYRGTAERQDFYFKSSLAKLEENEDEYSRCWVYLSDNFKNKLRSFLEHLNDDQGFKLPQEDELTSYDNPEYLWLAYELEHIRHAYNSVFSQLRCKKQRIACAVHCGRTAKTVLDTAAKTRKMAELRDVLCPRGDCKRTIGKTSDNTDTKRIQRCPGHTFRTPFKIDRSIGSE